VALGVIVLPDTKRLARIHPRATSELSQIHRLANHRPTFNPPTSTTDISSPPLPPHHKEASSSSLHTSLSLQFRRALDDARGNHRPPILQLTPVPGGPSIRPSPPPIAIDTAYRCIRTEPHRSLLEESYTWSVTKRLSGAKPAAAIRPGKPSPSHQLLHCDTASQSRLPLPMKIPWVAFAGLGGTSSAICFHPTSLVSSVNMHGYILGYRIVSQENAYNRPLLAHLSCLSSRGPCIILDPLSSRITNVPLTDTEFNHSPAVLRRLQEETIARISNL